MRWLFCLLEWSALILAIAVWVWRIHHSLSVALRMEATLEAILLVLVAIWAHLHTRLSVVPVLENS